MATISMRQLAICATPSTGDVVTDSPPVSMRQDNCSNYSSTNSCSVAACAQKFMQARFNVNIIYVAYEAFNMNEFMKVSLALHIARSIYSAVDIGIGWVKQWQIPQAQAGGFENIDSDSEVAALTNSWGTSNEGIDVYFVKAYAGDNCGRSAISGSCPRDVHQDMGGCVVEIALKPEFVGLCLAHELGHYLGLWHEGDSSNLMFHDLGNGGSAITADQVETIRKSCCINLECRC